MNINWDNVLKFVGIPGAISACLTLLIIVAGRTAGVGRWLRRKAIHREQLLQLSCGISFSRFDDILGVPYIKSTQNSLPGSELPDRYIQVYCSPYAYILAAGSNKDESVHAFAITIRTKKFRLPIIKLTASQIEGVIPSLRISKIESALRTGNRLVIGANRFGYAESYYFGNPGFYQTYVLAYNDAGVGVMPISEEFHDFSSGPFATLEEGSSHASEPSGIWFNALYRELRPNTIAVIGPQIDLSIIANYLSVGVDRSMIRHVPH
ncbi:ETEC_3214 domain-containing protein [Actinophytocola xanthii]|uniref:ETEC_3214 domain-containing protein n=1 Tax=Actinophytocola xanthii TaxID=1912961 RepID=UPI0011788B09|nr:ETEC_3214 domain-containing protein [Actinophytocola xanthii]